MNIYSFDCPVSGKILVNLKDIKDLFSVYGDIYKDIFSLNSKAFKKMKDFKITRGGVLIEIKNKDKTLGVFTLSHAKSNYLELGDLMKLDRKFPRESYAKAMRNACSYTICEKRKKGAYIYPNPYAISLEKMAGFKEHSLYVKRVSLIIFNLTLLLPVEIYHQRIHFSKRFYKHSFLRINLSVLSTRLTKFKLRVFKKSRSLDGNIKIMKVGLLYEFISTNTHGDPFLIFGESDFDSDYIGFEFCDNSA